MSLLSLIIRSCIIYTGNYFGDEISSCAKPVKSKLFLVQLNKNGPLYEESRWQKHGILKNLSNRPWLTKIEE